MAFIPTAPSGGGGTAAAATPDLVPPVLWETRTQTLSPQLPSPSPGGDPGPVIGRAIGRVDPGRPPEDTHVLVGRLVW